MPQSLILNRSNYFERIISPIYFPTMKHENIKPKNKQKGRDYIKIVHSIKKIKNFMQIEPTIRLIELFGNKTGDSQLRQELLDHLLEKAKHYQHYGDELLNVYRKHNIIYKE